MWLTPFNLGATYYVVAYDAPQDIRDWATLAEAAGANVKVCDGTADEVQIQAAIDSLPARGGTIHFSNGGFVLADKITMTNKDSVIIEGEGIFGTTAPSVGTVFYQSVASKSTFVLSSCQGVIFRDFCAYPASTTGTICFELVAACNNISFESLYLLSFDTLFDVSGGSTEIFWRKVQGGQGTTNYGAKLVGGQDFYFSDCFLPTASDTGVSIYLSSVKYTSIIGCVLRDSGYGILINGDSHYIRIIGNTFGGLDYPGVCIYADTIYPNNILITNNQFDACAANTTPGNPEDSNIYIYGAGGGSINSFIISDNVFNRGTASHPYYGMYLANVGYNKITDNLLIEGYYSIPIYITATAGGFTYPYNNSDYVTENSGSTTIGSGSTASVVTHGLAGTPTRVMITPTNLFAGTSDYYQGTATATQFAILTSADPGTNATYNWRAVIGEGN